MAIPFVEVDGNLILHFLQSFFPGDIPVAVTTAFEQKPGSVLGRCVVLCSYFLTQEEYLEFLPGLKARHGK
jgi:hypothetical protein